MIFILSSFKEVKTAIRSAFIIILFSFTEAFAYSNVKLLFIFSNGYIKVK